jgi:RNA polymerase sigma-70 factor (ECF subfamily)
MELSNEQFSAFSDQELLTHLAKGSKQAFTEIYNRYWNKLFYIAGKKVIDLGEAESLVHDVLADLWARRSSIDVKTELNHYLAAAMKYRVLKLLARERKSVKYSQDAGEWISADTQTPETILDFEELKTKLLNLVNRLPGQCRIAYELREKGLSQKEISREMKIAEHTVERHLSRATKFLRGALAHFLHCFLSSFWTIVLIMLYL